jgi:Protein of unknown function (DUF3592)
MTISHRYEKSGQKVTLAGWLRLIGFFLGVCALVAIVKTSICTYQESEHAKWPSVVAIITQQTVRKIPAGSHGEWYIESVLRYSVNGEELTSSTHSGGGAFWEELSMRKWASRHPPGTSLPIRYDPQHHDTVVPDAGDMPESGPQVPDDLKMILIFLVPSITLVTTGRMLQRRQRLCQNKL